MKQKERRRVLRPGLSVENGEPVDLYGAIVRQIFHGFPFPMTCADELWQAH